MRIGLGLNLAQFGSTADPSASYALYLDFKNSLYRSGATKTSTISAVPGYTYTRSGAKSELNGTAFPVAFAANVPGIVPTIGYWSRGALTNSVIQSQSFDNAAWAKAGVAVTADTGVAPDGTTTMDRITMGAATGYPYVQPNAFLSVASAVYTYSMFVKAGTLGFMQILLDNAIAGATQYANYNLSTGAVTATGAGGAGYTVNMGGGIWRLVYVTTATAAATASYFVAFSNSGTLGRGGSWAYNGETVEAWQGQALTGNFPDGGPIIATTTAAASIGADALAVGVANATYTATFTFDDASTQVIPGVVVSAGTFTLPVNPTTLTRGLVQKLVFV